MVRFSMQFTNAIRKNVSKTEGQDEYSENPQVKTTILRTC